MNFLGVFIVTQEVRIADLSLSPPPVSGLGYIVGSQVSSRAKDWHWALRVSQANICCSCVVSCCFPQLMSVCVVLPPSGDSGFGADRCAAAAVCGEGAETRSRRGPTRESPAPDQLARRSARSQQEVGHRYSQKTLWPQLISRLRI